jgi:hypothetical protein
MALPRGLVEIIHATIKNILVGMEKSQRNKHLHRELKSIIIVILVKNVALLDKTSSWD